MKEADIEIENLTEEFYTKYLLSMVKGMFTYEDAIEQEIEFNKMVKKNCEEYGYGNSRRIAIHILKVLEEIKNRHNAEYEKVNPLAPAQQTETKSEQETPTFTNNFDKIKPTEIYKHFKAGLVEKGYLTELELNEYLKVAFELKIIPETLFKIKDAPNKEKIYVVFYTYYLNVAGKPHKKQSQYVELLGNYFEGFNIETIRTNWARGYNPKKH
jgi:hypothetical protein